MVAVKTVVVADDTAFVRERFATAMEAAGHEVIAARSWSELTSLVRREGGRLDLIALDLRIPQGIGPTMVRVLRQLSGSETPIVVFSGTIADASEVRDLTGLGVSGYVNEYSATQNILPALAPHLFPEHYQRRSGPRVALGNPVAYRIGNTIASAVATNVSRGGLGIRTASPVEVGTGMRVRFRLPTSRTDIESEAQVVWAEHGVGMGVQFSLLDGEARTALESFVHGSFFSNRKA
jgi:uncharacterized protein (TIGR02266 family)